MAFTSCRKTSLIVSFVSTLSPTISPNMAMDSRPQVSSTTWSFYNNCFARTLSYFSIRHTLYGYVSFNQISFVLMVRHVLLV